MVTNVVLEDSMGVLLAWPPLPHIIQSEHLINLRYINSIKLTEQPKCNE